MALRVVPGNTLSLMGSVWPDGDVLAALDRAMEERGYKQIGMELNIDPLEGVLSTRYEDREYRGKLPVGVFTPHMELVPGQLTSFRIELHRVRLPNG